MISCNFFTFAFSLRHLDIAVNQMTMIYDPIPFVKLIQKFLIGNDEAIMRIGGKKYIINLNNLQMLFMLSIRYKFSECLPLLHNHEGPNGRLFLGRFCPGPQTRGNSGQSPPKSLLFLQILLCPKKLF